MPVTTTGSILYPLPSIVDPLRLQEVFPHAQPLEIELGSGDGSFLVQWAQRNPDKNFIGVERLLGRIRKLEKKTRRAGLSNLRAIRIESTYLLRFLLPRRVVAALHIYFPDPWPKRRHWRHRLINDEFPALASQVLTPDGVVYLRTDDPDYFTAMVEAFERCDLFAPAVSPATLLSVVTDFEREFRAGGVPTHSAAYRCTRAVR